MDVDLIAGVMSAAEPDRISKARIKLAELAGAPAGEGFNSALAQASVSERIQNRTKSDVSLDAVQSADRTRLAKASPASASATESDTAGRSAAKRKVLQEFESTLLASSLASIMPKSEDPLYGGGDAAEIWRGQQIQFMSQAMAERSPLGLLGMFGDSPPEPEIVAVNLGNGPVRDRRDRIKPFAYAAGSES